jgi:arylsulfatase
MEHTIPTTLQWDESFDVGSDTGTSVDDSDYQPPFRFTGTLDKLTIHIERAKLSPQDAARLQQAESGSNKASE